jgi:hypothetical protein
MSATVFSDSRYGVVDDSAASGMKLADINYNSTSQEAVAENHLGNEDGFAIYGDKTEVSASGVIATKTAGIGLQIANVITFLNASDDSLDLNDDALFTSSDANAGVVITSVDVKRANKSFEMGTMNGVYRPLVATDSPTVITD